MASANALATATDREVEDLPDTEESLASEEQDHVQGGADPTSEGVTAETSGDAGDAYSGSLRSIEGEAGHVAETAIHIENLSLFYGEERALKDISMEIPERRVTAFIGPSGCGKSSLLRCINRMNDLVPTARVEGAIRLGEQDIHAPEIDVPELRRRVGMVFQKPNPFPKSIYENVAYGLRIQGVRDRKTIDAAVEHALRKAALWEEVKDRLSRNAYDLSGGQQQRLVIARAIAIEPEVLLLDEPASALDPISTTRIENLIEELRQEFTIVIVTHNMQQAARISDYTAFLYMGELIEFGDTAQLFTNPEKKQTEDYITGKFG